MKKAKEQPENGLHLQSSFSDMLAEHPLIHWISDNGRTLSYLLLGSLCFIYFLYHLLGGSTSYPEKDFFQANRDLTNLQSEPNSNERQKALESLTRLLKKHPELQAEYDGIIAQDLLNHGEVQGALPYAQRNLDRVRGDHVTLYINYAKTTLLMGNKSYDDALKQALDLKQQILDYRKETGLATSGQLLYAFNLLRLATLSQQMENKTLELTSWQELQSLDFKILEAIGPVFQEGHLTLQDYIRMRMKALT